MSIVHRSFCLPDLGEGLTHGEISELYVSVGDKVVVDQIAVTVETAKSTVELPLPFDGEVLEIHGSVGEVIPVGEPLITLLTPDETLSENAPASHLVGNPRSKSQCHKDGLTVAPPRRMPPKKEKASKTPVSPSVRRLARQLNVELSEIKGSGQGGLITADDVRSMSNLESE